ncbi:FCD domain-containing protein, partial [Bacillaceae bacterium Marseille-Q3522]|nr:FCD domain-containing protein [Bacillaceae bacterium Marseille-Q3522]
TLEKEILKLSCGYFPKENLLELKKNVDLQEELLNQKGVEREYHKLDTKFHYIIFQGNNKENIWAAITRLSTHYNRIRQLSEMERSFEEAIEQHKIIIQLIENKEADKVDQVVDKHIVEPIKYWRNLYKPDSPYFNYFDFPFQNPELIQ